MQDQSNLVKNMATAFGQLAPNLLENVKINCNSQVEEEVSVSEKRYSDEFNEKNALKNLMDTDCCKPEIIRFLNNYLEVKNCCKLI